MKKLILQIFVSVDGFAADREKETVFFDGTDYNLGAEVADRQEGFIKSLDLILLGAETYRFFESHPQPKGYRLFPENIERLPLKLTEAKTFPRGATLHIYEPQKPLK